jgi:hypothetical protein
MINLESENRKNVMIIETQCVSYDKLENLLTKNGFNVLTTGPTLEFLDEVSDERWKKILAFKVLEEKTTNHRVDLIVSDLYLDQPEFSKDSSQEELLSIATIKEVLIRHPKSMVAFTTKDSQHINEDQFKKLKGVNKEWIFLGENYEKELDQIKKG